MRPAFLHMALFIILTFIGGTACTSSGKIGVPTMVAIAQVKQLTGLETCEQSEWVFVLSNGETLIPERPYSHMNADLKDVMVQLTYKVPGKTSSTSIQKSSCIHGTRVDIQHMDVLP